MDKRKIDTTGKPKVDPELEGFDIQIDSFGEIKSSFDISRINRFLDTRVDDKKLKNRKDLGPNNEAKSSEATQSE